jgi:hypothetical protein
MGYRVNVANDAHLFFEMYGWKKSGGRPDLS